MAQINRRVRDLDTNEVGTKVPKIGVEKQLRRVVLANMLFENQFYMACVNQAGKSGDTEYAGESLLLDPWGEDICHLEDDEDVAFGRVDTDVIHEVRSRINVFRDRRPDWDKVE